MQRWEYAVLEQHLSPRASGELQASYVYKAASSETMTFEETSPDAHVAILDRLGDDGWSLIQIELETGLDPQADDEFYIDRTVVTGRKFWFKRPC